MRASLEPDAAVDVAELLGAPLDAISRVGRIDVRRELAPALSGEIGVALVGGAELDPSGEHPFVDPPEIAAAIGLRKPAVVEAMLARLTAMEPLVGVVRRAEQHDGYLVQAPGEKRQLFLAVRAVQPQQLVVASSRALLGKLMKPGRGKLARGRYAHAEPWELGDASLRLRLDLALVHEAVAPLDPAAFVVGALQPAAAAAQPPPAESAAASKTPLSRKEAELRQLEQQIQSLAARQLVRAAARQLAWARRLGVVTVSVHRTRAGLEARTRYQVRDQSLVTLLGAVLERIAPYAAPGPQGGEMPGLARLVDLVERRAAVESELRELRAREVDEENRGDEASSGDAP